jgi:biopolymer transport protein TolQ
MFESTFYAFRQNDAVSWIIIGILIFGSIFSWAVMVAKWLQIRATRRATAIFLRRFRAAKHPLELYHQRFACEPSPLSRVYHHGARELCFHLLGSAEVDETFPARLRDAKPLRATALASVRSSMEQTASEESLSLESNLILLASAVSGSPFLGLLGTVWGVMSAFAGIAMSGKADFNAMAPGVAGALTTTVSGLLVAIPAMFGYNFLLTTIRAMILETENFSAECVSAFEHRYLEVR